MVTINIVLYAIKEIKNLDILKTVDMMARNPAAINQQIDLWTIQDNHQEGIWNNSSNRRKNND